MNEAIYIVAGGIGILIAGLGLGFWAAQLRAGKQAAKAEDVQNELDDYRQNVTEHFSRTAEHFQAIGQQYRELYEHMAGGAEALCDRQAMDEKLSFTPAALIEPADEEQASTADPAPRDYADGDESSEVETPAEKPVAANDDQADESETSAPLEDQIDDVEPAVKSEDAADGSERTYH